MLRASRAEPANRPARRPASRQAAVDGRGRVRNPPARHCRQSRLRSASPYRLACPTRGWLRTLSSRSRASNRDVSWLAARIAFTPSSGRPECAALPLARMRGRRHPLCAEKTALLVGSPITIKSGVGCCLARAREPPPLISSSATNIMISVPRQWSRCNARSRPASAMATIGPLASQAPRPNSLPSRSVRRNGSLVQPPPTGTVSICELKAKQGPSPLSMRPTTLARPSPTGRTSVDEADRFEFGGEESSGLNLPSRRVLRVDLDEPLKQASEPSDIGRRREGRKAPTALSLSPRLRRTSLLFPAGRRRSDRTGSSPRRRGWG